MLKSKRAPRPHSTNLTDGQVKEIQEKSNAGVKIKEIMTQYQIGTSKFYSVIGKKKAKPSKVSAKPKGAKKAGQFFQETFGGAVHSPHEERMKIARLRTDKLVDMSKEMQRQRVMVPAPTVPVDHASEYHRLRDLVIDQSHQLSEMRAEIRVLRRAVAGLSSKQRASV